MSITYNIDMLFTGFQAQSTLVKPTCMAVQEDVFETLREVAAFSRDIEEQKYRGKTSCRQHAVPHPFMSSQMPLAWS